MAAAAAVAGRHDHDQTHRGRTLGAPRARFGLALFAACVALTLALSALLTHGLVPWDADIYAQMAARPDVFTVSPLGYRLLTPWIVHVLPLPGAEGFWLLTVLALAGTATTLGLLCRRCGLGVRGALAAAALFLVSFGCAFDLHDARLVDPLAYLGTAAVFLFLTRRQGVPAAACIVLTTLDKEWGVFLILPFVVVLARQPQPQRRVALLYGVVGPVLAYWLVRHWPGFGTAAYTGYYTAARNGPVLAGALRALAPALLTTGGALWMLALLGWRSSRAPLVLRAGVLLVPGLAVQVALATDTARMLAFAAPCLIPLALCALDRLGGWRWGCGVLLLVAQCWLLLTPEVTPLVLWMPGPRLVCVAAATLALGVLFVGPRPRPGRRGPSSPHRLSPLASSRPL